MTTDFKKLYEEKLTTPEEAIKLVEPGEAIIYPLGAGEPHVLHQALTDIADQLEGNRLYTMLTMHPVIDVEKEKLQQLSFFLSGPDRGPFNEGKTDLIPNHFSEIPNILKEREDEPVLIGTVSPMDENGYFSLGVGNSYFGRQIKRAKKIILEVNETMPYTYGIDNTIHISQVDALVEYNGMIPVLGEPELNEKDQKIGDYIAEMIEDGDTIQVGIGAMPNAVMNNLVTKKNLGLHSEMFTSKAQFLHEEGVLTNDQKQNFVGQSISTFALGSQELYEFMNYNKDILMVPCDISNGQAYIAANDNFVSINSGVEVDLLGQVASERIMDKYYSSTGGQADFTKAVNLTRNGRGFIAMYSTAAKGKVSTIVPKLYAGSPASTSKNDIDMVVTEYGIAKLKGKTIRERVENLIAIAHPDFRDELRAQAVAMNYIEG